MTLKLSLDTRFTEVLYFGDNLAGGFLERHQEYAHNFYCQNKKEVYVDIIKFIDNTVNSCLSGYNCGHIRHF